MVPIDKNVSMPRTLMPTVGAKYPFATMEIGDSFLHPSASASKVGSVMITAAKRIGGGVKFASRAEGSGRRIWRIA